MKLLFSITYYKPYISGLTVYAQTLIQELSQLGYDVSVICMRHLPNLATKEYQQGVCVSRAVPILAVSKGFLSLDWFVKSWHEVRKTETIIVNLPQVEGVVPAVLSKIFNKRLIAVYHAEVVLRHGALRGLVQFFLDLSTKVILYLCDRVVIYTPEYGNYSQLIRPHLHKAKAIYPPMPLPQIQKKLAAQLAIKIQRRQGEVILGFCGRLAEDKGFDWLLHAIAYLEKKGFRKFRIAFLGPLDPVGEAAYKKQIGKLIEANRSKIVFLGTLDHDQMGTFYSLIDMLIVPSILESFGIVQVEAMMMGKPVVSTKLPGSQVPILRTDMGILVPPKDPDALSEAIIEVWKNKDRYAQMRRIAQKEFSLARTIDQWTALLGRHL